CLEAPKIKPYVDAMREAIAGILQLSITDVSVKATTTEKMGFAGREEGLMAYATALLQKI
ncbi:MAG: 2-C-methyl-D-erythritol 2,4-cyclodiphosphate synthase, partial [Sphingomonadales bacterium]